jgi:hypothetical protein
MSSHRLSVPSKVLRLRLVAAVKLLFFRRHHVKSHRRRRRRPGPHARVCARYAMQYEKYSRAFAKKITRPCCEMCNVQVPPPLSSTPELAVQSRLRLPAIEMGHQAHAEDDDGEYGHIW